MPIKRPQNFYPELGLQVPSRGETYPLRADTPAPQLHYQCPHGSLYLGDSLSWLRSLGSDSVDLVFADPPYNIGKAEWDAFESLDHYVEWSRQWIAETARILKPTGTIYVCGFSEILAHLKVIGCSLFRGCRWLVWHYKNKGNLGCDWGRSHESILHFRRSAEFTFNTDVVRIPYGAHTLKYPVHPQADTSQYSKSRNGGKHDLWTPHPRGAKPKDVFDIPTTCNGMGEKTPHPTQKPEELIRRLVLASTNPGDLVVDPFSGSGTTAVVSEQLQRRWLACDCARQYNEWAIGRLESVVPHSIEYWISLDIETARRRESIR